MSHLDHFRSVRVNHHASPLRYLRSTGFTDEDFVQYRWDPAVEPPRVLDPDQQIAEVRTMAKRGDVKDLDKDLQSSSWRAGGTKSKL